MTLTFGDRLTRSTWGWGNEYYTYSKKGSGILYLSDPKIEKLFILTNTSNHPLDNGIQEMKWDIDSRQFNDRIVTTTKIKEILDTAVIPMKVNIRGRHYVMGKGFLACTDGTLDILFAATCIGTPQSGNDLKLYKSRNIDLPANKAVKNAVDQLIAEHRGDILITNNLNKYIGINISLPKLNTVAEIKKYNKSIASECIEDFFKEWKIKSPEMISVDKKTKEKDILKNIKQQASEIEANVSYSAYSEPDEESEDYFDEFSEEAYEE